MACLSFSGVPEKALLFVAPEGAISAQHIGWRHRHKYALRYVPSSAIESARRAGRRSTSTSILTLRAAKPRDDQTGMRGRLNRRKKSAFVHVHAFPRPSRPVM